MTILLAEQTTQLFYEPLMAALGMIAAAAIIFLAVKGKLRDWFIR